MPDKPAILSEEDLQEIEALSAKVPDGPWFTATDDADDVPEHRRSGLALVETGRSADWWIARLCEWHTAKFIAESRTNIDALCQTVRVLRDERLEVQRALASSVLNDPTEDDVPPYSTTELVEGIRGLITRKESLLTRYVGLKHRLAQVEQERDQLKASRRVHELDNHHNALACGYCAGPIKDEQTRLTTENAALREQLAQAEKERDALRDSASIVAFQAHQVDGQIAESLTNAAATRMRKACGQAAVDFFTLSQQQMITKYGSHLLTEIIAALTLDRVGQGQDELT